jgi:hypothetical protein
MNKCRHCGAFVPVEKAFCPNCSEPMEPEEAPNRPASFSSDMMATMRDDPEQYRELLDTLKKKKAAGAAAAEAPTPAPDPVPAATPAVSYSAPQVAPYVAPPAKNKSSLALIIGAVFILILVVALLLIFKVI